MGGFSIILTKIEQHRYIKQEMNAASLELLRCVCGALLINIFAMTCSFVTSYVR